ncbi:MAG: ribose-5-phosphate isomerase RpiA [Spirochaetia bacterium]
MSNLEGKKAAGRAAAARVASGMKVGMGTGSTAVWAIRRVGERLASGEIHDVIAVATSSQSEMECWKLGIPLRSMNVPVINGKLDLTIDGADEVDTNRNLTKGAGGALLMEKIAAYSSDAMIVVVDDTKLVENLGVVLPVPLEVLSPARVPVMRALEVLGGRPEVRMAKRKMGAVVTDNGNIIVDVRFSQPIDPVEMETQLGRIPGVLGNGLFTQVHPIVIVGHGDGTIEEI